MMFKPHISDKFITLLGAAILTGLALSSWIPQPCSYLRRTLSSCPITGVQPSNDQNEAELKRVPHQDVSSSYGFFSVKSQDYREKTVVRFSYWGNPDFDTVFLQIKKKAGFSTLSLVTHPLLTKLSWPAITNDTYTLFQKDTAYPSIEELLKNPPAASELAVDSIVASQLGLKEGSYTLLDELTDLGSINYIITTYSKPVPDGKWYKYERGFNIQDATVNKDGDLEWSLYLPNQNSSLPPFRLGIVHIDYTQISPLP